MNTQPPHQPAHLSDEERELARVVRALPGGEPPAALDALILKAASDALASSDSAKKSRWNKAWLGTSALWLGTAAASVLTVGIGWEVFQSMRAPIYELPADENISTAQEIDNSHKNESIAIEVIPAREPAATAAPPADTAAEQENAATGAMASLEKAKAAKSEMRAAEIDLRREMADAGAAKKTNEDKSRMRNDQAIAADMSWPEAASAPASVTAAPAPMPAMSAPAPTVAGNSERQQLGAVTVTGSRIKQVGNEKVGPQTLAREADAFVEEAISEDAKLAPELWLAAIQARVDRDDIDGAKASLKLFKKKYPKQPIPEELKPLLK